MNRRVLYLMPNAVPGGAERATMMMVKRHDRHRYQPSLLFFSDGPLVNEARLLDVPVHVLPDPLHLRHPLSVARAVVHVKATVASDSITLIHSCMSYAHLVGGPAAAITGTPAVLYQHGPVGSWMDGAATMGRCDRILTNSAYTAAEQRTKSWRQRPIDVAPLAVDIQVADTERDSLRASVDQEFGLTPDAPLLGIVARFDPWKGIDIALRAAAPLLRARPEARFLVIGGQFKHFHPGYREKLEAIIEEERISAQVILAGYRLDVRPYLARMSVFVHASLSPEPFGLTILEAMACGVPVVAARGGGASEIVEDGRNGLQHTPGDAVSLRAALTRLIEDEPLRARLRLAGLNTVAAKYTPARMIGTLEDTYDQVLG